MVDGGFAFGIGSRERKKVKAPALLSLFFPRLQRQKRKTEREKKSFAAKFKFMASKTKLGKCQKKFEARMMN